MMDRMVGRWFAADDPVGANFENSEIRWVIINSYGLFEVPWGLNYKNFRRDLRENFRRKMDKLACVSNTSKSNAYAHTSYLTEKIP